MKRILTLLALCAIALTAIAAPAQDQPAAKKGARKDRPARQRKAGEGDQPNRPKAGGGDQPIRVLLTIGGHGFDKPAFFAMMDSIKGIKYDTIEFPKDLDQLKPGLEQKYDVILLYDQMKNLTPQQQQNLVALANTGIGLFPLHHNIGANSGWDEYAEIIGALYVRGPRVIDGVQYTKALSKDGQTLNVHVAEPNHFITRGLKDFTVVDEAYDKYYLDPRVKVLLTTEHPLNAKSVAWVTTYGKSPVFFFQLGHDAKAYDHPSFRQILARGLQWAARERKIMAGAKLDK